MVAYLIVAHLIGDFLFQNHWMQAKSKSSFVCTVHVMVYSFPFSAAIYFTDLTLWAWGAIMVQHWLQDRFALHTKWMKLYRQTTPDLWPVGPLCVDQAWHIGFIGIVCIVQQQMIGV